MSDRGLTCSLVARIWPDIDLPSTSGKSVNLRSLPGTSVVYIYPRTSPPDGKPIDGWDEIPGARGCTAQSCGFRDHHADLRAAGADSVFGLSTQSTAYQLEAVARLQLPYGLLSDSALKLRQTLGLTTFQAGGMELYERTCLLLKDGKIIRHIHPVTQPEQNASDVLSILQSMTPN